MIVAGEAGDRHAASLARTLARLSPGVDLELFGSGGEEMRAAGVETLVTHAMWRSHRHSRDRESARHALSRVSQAAGAARTRRAERCFFGRLANFNIRLSRKLHREGFKIV